MYELAKAITADRLRDADRRRQARAAREHRRRNETAERAVALARLRPLVREAGELAISDRQGWSRLRRDAEEVTATIAADGFVPRHLVVGPDDGPAVVNRTLAAVWRRLARTRP